MYITQQSSCHAVVSFFTQNAVGDHFKSRAQATVARQQSGVKGTGKPSRHIPPNLPAITHYRSKAIDCTHRLHSLTWDIAVRRANCFSQALGIAVTCYMSSLSDGGPASRGNASIWARHGYLITFEGLLSAVGKELGMIEGKTDVSFVRFLCLFSIQNYSTNVCSVLPHFRCICCNLFTSICQCCFSIR